ncbi:excisionase family protein [Grimontia kaedaensis]|uniref:Excisionase family protein n=1 Tax=Grimontia kaedaensis TaxID=2872157 RepID=A0ABY4WXH2_9GAMM|nr:excisionase family protein [Grimontia kaedaensis]USH03668.1 excisionase family protein [Grimontia kaedaensis]
MTALLQTRDEPRSEIVIALPKTRWVGEDIICATYSLTNTALESYRRKVWLQGIHYRKVSTTGQVSATKAKVVYNLAEIEKWIESHPQ